MNYKLEGAIRKNRKYFIIFGILWLFIAIVLIVPLTIGANAVSIENDLAIGISKFVQTITNPFNGISEIISNNLILGYLKNLGLFTIIFSIFFIIGVARSAPKHEYTDFEHGSSDWSKNGEQYQILSNKKDVTYIINRAINVKINPEEMSGLKNLNISVAHCPVSNLKLGCGIAKIKDFIENGINVSLGTDGQGSGSNLDMFSTMAYTALLQKGINEDATLLPAYDVIKMATINGAKALNADNEIGSIEEGKKADLIILDLETTMTEPINDVFSNIVYNVKPNNVITTIVNGKILMEDRKIEGINEEEVYQKCNSIIRRLT